MTVRIVTDSCADLPPGIAQELDITVVPAYVRFGERVYRDIVDISHDELYQKLLESPIQPTTSQPSPGDFADAYRRLAKETDEILSIQVTSKLSGTYNSALQGRELVEGSCHIEIVDSLSVSMGLGLITMAAARLAKAGKDLQEIVEEVKQSIPRMHMFAVFNTLKYILRGGRLGKAKALLGSMLNVKPLLTMRNGVIWPAGLARTRAKGIERLVNVVKNSRNIQDVAIVHSTTPDEAQSLKERIGTIFDRSQIYISQLGPALGVHGGPGALLLALREKVTSLGQEAEEGEQPEKRNSLPSWHLPKLGFSRL